MYGTGMRISEVLRLRIKDIDFEHHYIIVRSGKGLKDWRVTLSKTCIVPMKDQINHVTKQHQQDLKNGVGETLLPKALAKKYPQEGKKNGVAIHFLLQSMV